MKYYTLESIHQRTQEQTFRVMLNACLNVSTSFDASEVLSIYYLQAFKYSITESEIDNNIFDKIRTQLLIRGGIQKPILHDCNMWKKIKQSFTFE